MPAFLAPSHVRWIFDLGCAWSRRRRNSSIVDIDEEETSNAHVSGVTTSLESYEDAVVVQRKALQTVHQTVPECGQRQRKRGWIPLQILPCRQTTAHLGPGGLLEHGLVDEPWTGGGWPILGRGHG
eukprot:scaffold9428_cov103-Cylindrotheca_fusiformis.AAC.3